MGTGLYGDSLPILEETLIPTAGGGVLAWRFVDDLGNNIAVSGARAAGVSAPFDSLTAGDVTNKRALRLITIGCPQIELGGTVVIGDKLMSNGTGQAIKWVPGANNFINGRAREGGVSGDRIRIFFNSQDAFRSGLLEGSGAVLAIAANAVAPTNKQHHVGAGLLKNITVPAGGLEDGAVLQTVPDAAYTYDATGNINLPVGGGTAVINKVMYFAWDAVNSKWNPSY
jgi:hypothetical protein